MTAPHRLAILASAALAIGCSSSGDSNANPSTGGDAASDAADAADAAADTSDGAMDASEAGPDVATDAVADVTSDASSDAVEDEALPKECVSNIDCAAPTNLCDTIQGVCVECLTTGDCGHMPGTVCSKGACICPNDGDSWCPPGSCVDLQTSSNDCGSCGRPCFGACSGGTCVDPWEPIAEQGGPEARAEHVAVWTGTEMVVWGGSYGDCDACNLDTGGIYDHGAFEWRPTSLVDAPTARRGATAVWTGSLMLVWGGYHGGSSTGTGARFDPVSNTWSPISTVNAPSARYGHTAVWTGSEMIVWGGTDGVTRNLDGKRYDPSTDQWTSMAPAALAREYHTAVWTNGKMLIYGGRGNDGVDPNAYLPTATAVGGGAYDSVSNSWSIIPATGQPSSRAHHVAVAIGNAMVVWGGFNGPEYLSTGGVFETSWIATTAPEPEARQHHTAVVLENQKMVVFGGSGPAGDLNTGGSFDSSTNTWAVLPIALSARQKHTAVSTGAAMMVWGGKNGSTRLAGGAVYVPD